MVHGATTVKSVDPVTVSAADPVPLVTVAVTVSVPTVFAVTRPLVNTTDTTAPLVVQFNPFVAAVRTAVLPSLKVPVATSVVLVPIEMVGLTGVTALLFSVATGGVITGAVVVELVELPPPPQDVRSARRGIVISDANLNGFFMIFQSSLSIWR